MKKFVSMFMLTIGTFVSQASQATIIDFNNGLDPFFNYSGVATGGAYGPYSGYTTMANFTDGGLVAYNPYEVSPSTFTKSDLGTFDFTSFLIDGAWGSQTVTVDGLLNETILYHEEVFITRQPRQVIFNWLGINQFRITTGTDFIDDPVTVGVGQHWVIDNLVVNENNSEVPEPATAALLGSGLLSFATSRCKSTKSNNV